MNILHLKYAVEVAKVGSINKASENLLIAQPNLSRAIKDLEADLGITIFDRSAKGMCLTPEGADFIAHARKILQQIDEVSAIYKSGHPLRRYFSISVPHASYISEAFCNFSKSLKNEPIEISYKEADTQQTLEHVLRAEYKLGILRYPEDLAPFYRSMLEDKGLCNELITTFRQVVLLNQSSPLAAKNEITLADLQESIEIVSTDQSIPFSTFSEGMREGSVTAPARTIRIYERATAFDLLSSNSNTYLFGSPIPPKQLQRYGLIQRTCKDVAKVFRDVLIYRGDYHLSPQDNDFITELWRSKRESFK